MRKMIALLLALLMLFGMVACGTQKTTDASVADEPIPEAPTVDTPAEIPTDEPAETPVEEEREHVTLEFYSRCTEQPDQDAVFAAFNKYCEEKLNTTVNWHFLGGTFNDKVSVMINAGDPYDVVWTSNWSNDYATNVARGAYADLTDLLANEPELVASMPEGFWDATRINGRIYAVPCQQIAARTPAMTVTAEYALAFGMDHDTSRKTYYDFEDFIQFAFDTYGAKAAPVAEAVMGEYCGYEFLNGQASAAAVKYGDPSATVVNFYATEEFKALCEEMRYFFEKGQLEPLAFTDIDLKYAEIISGRVSLYADGTYKPGGEIESSNSRGITLHQTPHDTSYLTTSSVIATMWAISASSQYPDRALEILSMLSTDPYAMNLISWGIEGVHHTLEDGFMVMTENGGYNPSASWALGNVFLTHPMKGQPATVWEETAEINASAEVSALIGFNVDITNVETEITNVVSVFEQYKTVASGSLPVDETLAEFNAKLEDAGMNTILSEFQTQVDAFLAG